MSGASRPVETAHQLVRASAGSGKTFQLTNRLLALLLRGEDAGSLLATTFTRAAAGEILHRLLARLSDAAVEEKALAELREHIDAGLTHERCGQALERIVGEMHRLSVMTIDAFFSRLASSFALELGLAPGWRMLDEEEDARLRAAAVDRTLRDAPLEEALVLLRDLQGERIRTDAHRAIMQIVNEGYSAYLETGGDEAVWTAVGPTGSTLSREALAIAMCGLDDFDMPLTNKGTARHHWATNIEKASAAAASGDWTTLVGLGLVTRIIDCAESFDRAEIEDHHREALVPFIEHARHALTSEHATRTRAALDLLRRFDGAYLALKRSLGAMTFDDPPRLLLEAETTGDLAHLYFRLDARIRHVLLDEFQDTSMMQFRLLEPILDEMLSQAEDGRSVFCVGDAKQSLYAWRNAEPTLLPALGARWAAFEERTLAQSHRSAPVVLEAVNAIFANVSANPAMGADRGETRAAQEWDARFDAHSAARGDLAGTVRLSVASDPKGVEPEDVSASRAVLETAAQRVAEARQRAPGASIAVLVRTGKELRTALGMLKRRKIDASEQRGNPLVDAPPVAAAMSMLRLIDHPGHTAALFHAASTPLGAAVGLTSGTDATGARRVAARWRRRIGERGCAAALAEWHEACIGAMDERSAARFEQLIALAEAWDASGAGGAAEFADLVETRRVDEPGRAPVRVMTIHGAKGLEFDVVVLPLMRAKAWAVGMGGVIAVRDEPLGPVTRVSRYPSALMRRLHPDLEDMHARAMQRQVNEELCALYVGATRAKRCLEMVVPADKEGRAGRALSKDDWKLKPDHVVRFALAPDAPAAPGATLWAISSDADWAADESMRRAGATEDAPPTVTLTVRASAQRSATRLAGATPSRERGGGAIDAASLLARRDPRGLAIGDLVHGWFERIEWIEEGGPDEDALAREALERGADADAIARALGAFRTGLAGESVRSALSREAFLARWPGAREAAAHRERPFAVRDGDRLLEGRFDRLVVGLADGRPACAEVIDFKTDHGARSLTGEALREYAEAHRAQMEAYRRAAARLLRLGEDRVGLTLVFTAAGEGVGLERCAEGGA